MKLSEITEPIRVMTTWVAMVLSILFVMAAIVLFPTVLAKWTDCGWWYCGYGCYVFVLWFMYQIFVE